MITAKFENIGPIKSAELELGDFTIIAGQNNTGKTYLVYTLYGFLHIWQSEKFKFLSILSYNKKLLKKLENLAEKIKKTNTAEMDFSDYERLQNWIIEKTSSNFINHVFSSPNGEFEKARFSLKTSGTNSTMENEVHFHGASSLTSHAQDKNLILKLNNSDDINLSTKDITNILTLLFLNMIEENQPKPFILSTERFGISLFYKELDFTKNRLVEELQKLSDKETSGENFDPFIFIDRESARYAKPIKDNIDFTRDLARIQKKKSNLLTDKNHSIEKIMDGYFKANNNEIRFISKKRGDNRFDIPLHLASSSARGVSDLYFYLKHVAGKGQILIIDEPESHLSPTNQILMARLLAFCVNSGLKVLITTHSDYLIKEINNLIMLNSDFDGKNAFLNRHKKNYTSDDCLKPESVKAYVCEDGKLESCVVNETGINMPVFDDAIDKINKISNELDLLITTDDS